jgi:hypothetical protein
VSARVAFRQQYGVGARKKADFAAQWLAYAFPCRRFAEALADICARLGADVVCYSFIVTDFHRLLLAGLPAHTASGLTPKYWEQFSRMAHQAVSPRRAGFTLWAGF